MDDLIDSRKTQKTSIEFRRLTPYFAAEVTGIDLRQPQDDATIAALNQGLLDHEVLVLRDQDITIEQQMAFGRCFGELSVHPFAPHDDDIHELIVFDNDENNPATNTDNWHSDETFREVPPMATVLRAIEVPALGGNTLFTSMTTAYEALSDRLKTYISGLEAVHEFKLFRNYFSDSPEDLKRLRDMEGRFPRVTHPVVREHPVSGKRVLFVNPHFTLQIKGMTEIESQALLSVLYHQAELPEFQYRHQWVPNTLVIWDNRSTQHYAPHDYTQRRFMHRVTIKGDRPKAAIGI